MWMFISDLLVPWCFSYVLTCVYLRPSDRVLSRIFEGLVMRAKILLSTWFERICFGANHITLMIIYKKQMNFVNIRFGGISKWIGGAPCPPTWREPCHLMLWYLLYVLLSYHLICPALLPCNTGKTIITEPVKREFVCLSFRVWPFLQHNRQCVFIISVTANVKKDKVLHVKLWVPHVEHIKG